MNEKIKEVILKSSFKFNSDTEIEVFTDRIILWEYYGGEASSVTIGKNDIPKLIKILNEI